MRLSVLTLCIAFLPLQRPGGESSIHAPTPDYSRICVANSRIIRADSVGMPPEFLTGGQRSSAAAASSPAVAPDTTEEKVIRKLESQVTPGQPLVVSRLYNEVFTDPVERKALDRLFNLFFKIPIYIVQEFETSNKPPSLQDISRQFRLNIPGEAGLLLTIMEADPRVPKFFQRDPTSGEITSVEPATLRANHRFATQMERSLTGLEGQAAPDFTLLSLDGSRLALSSLRGKGVLLYFWFSNCPPCVQISSNLVALQRKYGGEKFSVLGLNADRVLELPYTDSDRAAYARNHQLNFPNLLLDAGTLKAYGEVSIFPTLFLIGPDGMVQKQFINYQSLETLEKALQ